MNQPILALDQGTSSSRAIVFEADGSIRAVAQTEFAQHYPRSGCGTRSRGDLVHTLEITRRAIAEAGLAAGSSPGSASRTSARRSCSGIERPVSRFTLPSSGRTDAPPTSASVALRRPRGRDS